MTDPIDANPLPTPSPARTGTRMMEDEPQQSQQQQQQELGSHTTATDLSVTVTTLGNDLEEGLEAPVVSSTSSSSDAEEEDEEEEDDDENKRKKNKKAKKSKGKNKSKDKHNPNGGSIVTAATTESHSTATTATTTATMDPTRSRHLSLAQLEATTNNHSKRFRFDEKLTLGKAAAISQLRESHIKDTLEDQEIDVRKSEGEDAFLESIHSVFSSLKVIFVFLLTKETYVPMALAVLSTCYFYFLHRDNENWDGGGIPFVVLGVAVVIPTINLITMEYQRREQALLRLGELRAVWLRIYQLHALMDWDHGQGRAKQDKPLGIAHLDRVGDNILGACDELMRFLTLPSSTQTQNYLTTAGRIRATHILSVAEPLFESCTARRGARFTRLAERLKASGAAQTEMSRMEQFQKDMQAQYEHLRFVKMYRTPQALRSLARITTIMMLPLFGPSYAQLAINIGSLFLGLMLTAVSALILSGLYEAARVVEDPFTAFVVMDGINIREEMDTLHRQLAAIREEVYREEARDNPYEIPASRCMTSATVFTYFGSQGNDTVGEKGDEQEEEEEEQQNDFGRRVETTFRTGGVDMTNTTETIMAASPSQKNRRKRFGPIR